MGDQFIKRAPFVLTILRSLNPSYSPIPHPDLSSSSSSSGDNKSSQQVIPERAREANLSELLISDPHNDTFRSTEIAKIAGIGNVGYIDDVDSSEQQPPPKKHKASVAVAVSGSPSAERHTHTPIARAEAGRGDRARDCS